MSSQVNVTVVDLLRDAPRPLAELREATACPATTMRRQLRALTEMGVIERTRQAGFPGVAHYELGAGGGALLPVLAATRSWLAAAPNGPLLLGSSAAKSAIKAFIDAWTSGMLRALAARPLSLTELDRLIPNLSYPALERRLTALRLTGQVRRTSGRSGGAPYAVTDWLRRAVAPVVASAQWENAHARGAAASTSKRDVETALLLCLPLLRFPADLDGSCRLAVELSRRNDLAYAGVLVKIENERVVSCVARLEGEAAAWASGSAADWAAAVISEDPHGLEIGGETQLASGVLEGLHRALVAQPALEMRSG